MYLICTEIENYNAWTDDLDRAEQIAQKFAAEGHQVEIRNEDTGETIKLYNCEEED